MVTKQQQRSTILGHVKKLVMNEAVLFGKKRKEFLLATSGGSEIFV